MKYEELTLEQVKTIVNKLGIEVVERLLRNEIIVNTIERSSFKSWKKIKLGNFKNVKTLKDAITNIGFQISKYANDIMDKPTFHLSLYEKEINLARVTVAELGFIGSARYDAICDRIRDFGYELCPAEVGPQLCLQYPDQPLNEWLAVAMIPIEDSRGDPCIFGVSHDGDGRWLRGSLSSSGRFWHLGASFVIAFPPTPRFPKDKSLA